MRYLLVVGFACDVYQREPIARIFVDEKLMDEFNIIHHKKVISHMFENKHILQPFTWTKYVDKEIKNFPGLRFYEIEIDHEQKKLKLRIDIKNNDNNYVNGFITKSTLIKLQVFYFFPLNKKIISRLQKIKQNQLKKNCAWFYNNNTIFNIVLTDLQWYGKNKQIIKYKPGMFNHNIGGNGYFTCELIKKYGILIPKAKKSYIFTFPKFIIDYLLNKYQQHANQRNCN